MTTIDNLKEEKRNFLAGSLHAKKASWNNKRKYNFHKYVRSVF